MEIVYESEALGKMYASIKEAQKKFDGKKSLGCLGPVEVIILEFEKEWLSHFANNMRLFQRLCKPPG